MTAISQYLKLHGVGVNIEQFVLEHLSQHSYVISNSDGTAFVIDPPRDTTELEKYVKAHGLKVEAVIVTHNHADFVSGHENFRQLGAKIIFGNEQNLGFPVTQVANGEKWDRGNLRLTFSNNPGHTDGHLAVLVSEIDANGKELEVFYAAGDALFIGGAVGRIDLNAHSTEELKSNAQKLYDSLQEIKKLSPEVVIGAAHGNGSPCGDAIGDETFGTLADELKKDSLFTIGDRKSFVAQLLKRTPPEPLYYQGEIKGNRRGYKNLQEVLSKPLDVLNLAELWDFQRDGGVALYIGDADEYDRYHPTGAVYIGEEGDRIAEITGTYFDASTRFAIITEAGKENLVRRRLADIGYDNVAAYLSGGTETLRAYEGIIENNERLSAKDLQELLASKTPAYLIDVRTRSEIETGLSIPGAVHIQQTELHKLWNELPHDETPVIFLCAAGRRSHRAASAARQQGINATDLEGGIPAWAAENYELTKIAPRHVDISTKLSTVAR